ncbi:MAG: cysteine desulfurase [Bdellovibrionales bacterium]|nr:cysteine desulfurase [Bdellovibrionales bacterium]
MFRTIYLDHNATTPLHPAIRAKLPEWAEFWGNPSSIHWAGRGPKSLYRDSKQKIASLLGVQPLELIFTSGGSESNNLALKGLCEKPVNGRDQIVISAVEHPSLRKTAEALIGRGFRVDVIGVNRDGELDIDGLQALLSEKTFLVSVMLANNETGHLMPVNDVSRRAHAVGAWVHCDAVQALGKIPLHLPDLGADLVSLSAHKFYSLKGSGVLYARRGLNLKSLIDGGAQERGRRAGTENLLSIASFGWVCGLADEILPQALRLRELRDHMEARVLSEISGVKVNGPLGSRLPNTSSMILNGVDGETLLMNLDVRGFAVSTGAACSSGSPEPSPVLLAMGLTREEAQSSLRVSLGWGTTREEIDLFVDELKNVVHRLRGFKHGECFAYGV